MSAYFHRDVFRGLSDAAKVARVRSVAEFVGAEADVLRFIDAVAAEWTSHFGSRTDWPERERRMDEAQRAVRRVRLGGANAGAMGLVKALQRGSASIDDSFAVAVGDHLDRVVGADVVAPEADRWLLDAIVYEVWRCRP